MKTLFLLSLLALSNLAQAGDTPKAEPSKLTCFFTEPFITVEYDLVHNRFVREEANEMDSDESTGEVIYKRRVSDGTFEKIGPKSYRMTGARGAVVVELDHDFKGNDGMSDFMFPYSAAIRFAGDEEFHLFGGCESDVEKRWNSL